MPMRGRTGLAEAAAAIVLLAPCGVTHADDAATTASGALHDGQRDFDFLIGSWKIHLKKRLHPLSGSNEWVEFDGTVVCRTIWNGLAEVEEFNVDSPEKSIFIKGVAVRLYNPKTRQWTIYWANSKNGAFDPQAQVGRWTRRVLWSGYARGQADLRSLDVVQHHLARATFRAGLFRGWR